MTKEQIYTAQLKELGLYHEAFDPEIKTLASIEREWTRAKKAWAATAPKGEAPSFTHELYGVVQDLRREMLLHRESLGLTPKALRRLQGVKSAPAGSDSPEGISQRLDALLARTEMCGGVDVSELDIGGGADG